jgi:hypothetical protein
VAAGLARLIEETGWSVSVVLDKEAPRGEFAVYLDEARIFSRFEVGRMPVPEDIIPVIQARLFGDATTERAAAGELSATLK